MKTRIFATITGAILGLALGAPSARAQGENSGRLVGAWQTDLAVHPCPAGPTIRTFPEMLIFGPGGTAAGSTAGVSPALLTAGIGSWRHISGHIFVSTVVLFRFNPDLTFAGSQKVTRTIELLPTGNDFTSTNTVEFRDAAGNVTGTGCSTQTGRRLE